MLGVLALAFGSAGCWLGPEYGTLALSASPTWELRKGLERVSRPVWRTVGLRL